MTTRITTRTQQPTGLRPPIYGGRSLVFGVNLVEDVLVEEYSRRAQSALSTSGVTRCYPTQQGKGLRLLTGGYVARWASPANVANLDTGDFLIQVVVQHLTAGISNGGLICKASASTSTGLWTLHLSSGNLVFTTRSGSTNTDMNFGAVPTLSLAPHSYVVCKVGTVIRAFIDGVEIGTGVTWTAPAAGNTSEVSLNATYYSASDSAGGVYLSAHIWKSAVVDATVRALSDNPWRIYAPVKHLLLAAGEATLSCETGSFALTGIAAARQVSMLASTGSFALTGIDASRRVSSLAGTGAFALTGIAAGLLASRTVATQTGVFTLTGVDAALTASGSLTAETGSFALTGIDASRRVSSLAGTGAFVLAGVDASLSARGTLTAETGAFALTGVDAARQVSMLASVGAFALTGIDAGLGVVKLLAAETGAFTLTGVDAGLLLARSIAAETGAFVLTGYDTVIPAHTMAASTGAFILTGVASFILLRGLPSGGGVPKRMLRPIPSGDIRVQNDAWRQWFYTARKNVNPAIATASPNVFTLGTTAYTHGTVKASVAVGAEAGGTATSGGYGFVSAAEFNAHMAQVEAMRQALLSLGIAVP